VLAIAASAGGPDALAEVLRDLSPDLPLRVIVAQHIEPPFTSGLATWLAARAMRRVEIADEGRALDTEAVLLVRSDRQPFVDRRGIVRYRALDPANPFHPCIDALLTSLAEAPSLRGAAALLTGMGADGAAGLLALRRVGWVTIAQDAATSKVFGMPRAAAELGAASLVVPLDRIGATASRALRADVGARP
jgi:chemotaxis response regulator CheB